MVWDLNDLESSLFATNSDLIIDRTKNRVIREINFTADVEFKNWKISGFMGGIIRKIKIWHIYYIFIKCIEV